MSYNCLTLHQNVQPNIMLNNKTLKYTHIHDNMSELKKNEEVYN